MKYFLTFVKLPKVYMQVNAGNKTQAIAPYAKYRNDIIANTENDLVFSFKDAVSFQEKWKEININDLQFHANTKKKFKVTSAADGSVEYYEMIQEDLDKMLLARFLGSMFYSIPRGTSKARYLGKKVKKEQVLLYSIEIVSKIPLMLDGPKAEPEVIQESETKEIEVEVV
jgi:hypothetical protein